MAERQMLDDEKWTRITIGMGHTIGGGILKGLGAGAVVEPMGNLEAGILDSAFADRMAPSPVLNERAREVASTPPVTDTTMTQTDSAKPDSGMAGRRWDSKKTA